MRFAGDEITGCVTGIGARATVPLMPKSRPQEDARPPRLFPNRIRARRKELGLTQIELSKLVNMTYQNVGKIERGEVNLLAFRLEQFAKALDCEPGDLLGSAPALNPRQRAMLDLFGQLSQGDQERLLRMGAALAEPQAPYVAEQPTDAADSNKKRRGG